MPFLSPNPPLSSLQPLISLLRHCRRPCSRPMRTSILIQADSLAPSFPPSLPPLHLGGFDGLATSFLYSVPLPKIVFDLATIGFILALILLSVLAFAAIFYLYERSRRAYHLQHFNALWTVRLQLVTFVSIWSVNEILRLPFVRRKYLLPFQQSISLEGEANVCQLNVVLSLGFLQPGFLMTLLHLVNVSIKKRNPNSIWAMMSVLVLSFPNLFLQIFFVYFTPFANRMPRFMYVSSVVSTDLRGDKMVLCTCPFFSWLIYGGFSVAYAAAFALSSWRVMAFVINKGIAHRINLLSTTVMVAIPAHVLCLVLSWMWMPDSDVYGAVVLATFLSVAGCMAVAVVVLVVMPVREALEAGGDCGWCGSGEALRRREQEPDL